MEPITLLVTALVTGAGVAGKTVIAETVKDAYGALKKRLQARYADQADLSDALKKVEADPASEGRQILLREELEKARADQDGELQQLAQKLLEVMEHHNLPSGPTYRAYQTSSGGQAVGENNVVAGQGGIAAGGNVKAPSPKPPAVQ